VRKINMAYKFIIRTYSKDDLNVYAEGAYDFESAMTQFNDICKTCEETVELLNYRGIKHFIKVVIFDVERKCNIEEKCFGEI
jgi:hypothetical protein